MLAGPQRHTLLVGGARSGKTFLLCRAILIRAMRAPGSRHAILRFHGNAARASIWLDTLPRVARICFPGLVLTDHQRDSFVSLPNSAEIWIGGLDEKERVEKILGTEFSTIYLNEASQIPYSSVMTALTRLAQVHPEIVQRAYYDLNPIGKSHWSYRLFVQHIDPETRRVLSDADNYRHAFLNPLDNRENLTPEYLRSLEYMPPRQRRRFFEGVYVEEIEGALWTMELLAHARCAPEDVPQTLTRVVIGVDPSGTSGDAETRSDNVGIVVAGLDAAGRAYVLADLTCNLAPEGWGRRVAAAFRHYNADRVVAERNFGGDMVRAVIHGADRSLPVHLVTASRGKAVRAEPVSVFYGHEAGGEWINDRVRHAGEFPDLEEELLNYSTAGYLGPKSPDRADALIWALTELLVKQPPAWATKPIVSPRGLAIYAR